jgi:hypothetical protein
VQKVLVVNLLGMLMLTLFLDTREYEVEFTNGNIEQYAMNVVANNMYAQVDDKGNMFQLLDEIMDHKDDTAIDIAYGTVTLANGNVKPKITMAVACVVEG